MTFYSEKFAHHYITSASTFDYRTTKCLNWFTIPISNPEFWLYDTFTFSSNLLRLRVDIQPIIHNTDYFTCIQVYKSLKDPTFQHKSQHMLPPSIVYEFTPNWIARHSTVVPGRMWIYTGNRVHMADTLDDIEIGVTRKIDPIKDVSLRIDRYITVANF